MGLLRSLIRSNRSVSYLLADDAPMADAILALSHAHEAQRDALATLIAALVEDPALLSKLVKLLQLPKQKRPRK
jgi:hypothetical protein